MTRTDWTHPKQVDAFLDAGGSGIIYKHSSICSVSSVVIERAIEPFVRDHPDAPIYQVLVVEHRPASNRIAERLGIRHESPQAIVVRDGAVVWNASHLRITPEDLAKAWAG